MTEIIADVIQLLQILSIILSIGTSGRRSSRSKWHDVSGQYFCQTQVLGLGLGVDFTFAGDNHNNHNHNNHNLKNDNNPHLNFVKGTVLGDKEQGVGIRDKG